MAGQFTFLCFAAGDAQANSYYDEYFYKTGYVCNESYQSFVVDNQTGKVYSLESVGAISEVNEYSVVIDGIHHHLSVGGNGLEVSKVVDNPNVSVYGVFKDKYGHTFVETDSLDEAGGEVLYYTSSGYAHRNDHVLGDDGRIYVVGEELAIDYAVRYYDENFQLRDVEDNVTVAMQREGYISSYLLKDNCLFIVSDPSVNCYPRGEHALFEFIFNGFSLVEDPLIVGDCVFGVKEDTRMLCVYGYEDREAGRRLTKTEIMNVNDYYKKGDYLFATVESASATKQYKIWAEQGTVKKELIEQTVYEGEIFVAEPLNG